MKTEELSALLRSHPALRREVALEMQSGLPQFLLRGGELCVRFLPHKIRWDGDALCFGAPKYEIELVWPFRHLVFFRSLALDDSTPDEPVCRMARETLPEAKRAISAYQAAADALLSARENQGRVAPDQVEACRLAFDRCVSSCGLGKVYGGEAWS